MAQRTNAADKSRTKDNAPSPRPEAENPKQAPAADNRLKDPDEWVTGHEPMTGAQASYLKTLSEQTHHEEAFEADLDKAEASKRIDALRQERD